MSGEILNGLVGKGHELSMEMRGSTNNREFALIDGAIIGVGIGLGGLFGGVVAVSAVALAESLRFMKNMVKIGLVNGERAKLSNS